MAPVAANDDDERRRKYRHVTCVPAEVANAQKGRLALIRDASAAGALLLSRSQFLVNEAVRLTMKVPDEDDIFCSGKVVRVERLKDSVWKFSIAVEFEPAREDLVPIFKALAKRQGAW